MDKVLKWIEDLSVTKFLYGIYFLLFLFFVVVMTFLIPHAVYFSEIINGHYPSPKTTYGAEAFHENSILNLGQTTSIYRGDIGRNGSYQNIIPLNLKVLWRSFNINGAVHGASKASPAVDDSGIYVGGDDGWFYAFNHDGSLKWRYYTFYNWRGIHSTAMLSENYVWFGSYNGRFYCLEKETGKIMWSLKLADAIGSSPLIHKGFIYLSVETTFLNGYVVKINAKTGKVIWRSPWLGEQIHSSVSLNPKDRLLYVGANNSILFALHMDEGQIFWSYDAEKPIKGTPVFSNGIVYFSGWNKRLTALNGGTGQVLWETYIHSPSQSTPTNVDGMLVLSTHREKGGLIGVRKTDGKILWKMRLFDSSTGLNSGFGARGVNGKWFYYGMCSTNFCVMNPRTGEILKRVDVGGILTGVLVPYKSFIYLSLNDGGLLKLGR